MVLTIAM